VLNLTRPNLNLISSRCELKFVRTRFDFDLSFIVRMKEVEVQVSRKVVRSKFIVRLIQIKVAVE